MTLTEEQGRGVELIQQWLATHEGGYTEFKLGGYAGTGKTTMIKTILETLGLSTVVSAFTGKACHVLERKGIPAQTLHSLMYDCHKDPFTGEMVFEKKGVLPICPDLVVVDEASMLSTTLYEDLRSFNVPCLFVGDPGQLEPVGDNPNLMKEPDYVLSTIHRQAADNPIIAMAQAVRTGSPPSYRADDGKLYVSSGNLNTVNLLAATQIICAKNKTRKALNSSFRKYYGRDKKGMMVEGEKLIVLRNNPTLGVFNGMMMTVVEVVDADPGWAWDCLVEDEIGNRLKLPLWQRPFLRPEEKVEQVPRKVVYCDYGYAITCHKAQGSEWKHVHVVDEWVPPQVWDMKRWRYTAITRAAERLVYTV